MGPQNYVYDSNRITAIEVQVAGGLSRGAEDRHVSYGSRMFEVHQRGTAWSGWWQVLGLSANVHLKILIVDWDPYMSCVSQLLFVFASRGLMQDVQPVCPKRCRQFFGKICYGMIMKENPTMIVPVWRMMDTQHSFYPNCLMGNGVELPSPIKGKQKATQIKGHLDHGARPCCCWDALRFKLDFSGIDEDNALESDLYYTTSTTRL